MTSDKPEGRTIVRPSIQIKDLSYSYGRQQVLNSITANITGGVIGLVGPNGSGKSTLLGCIATTLRVSPSQVKIDGIDVAHRDGRSRVRERIGYLPQGFDLLGSMKVHNTIAYAAWTSGIRSDDCDGAAAEAANSIGIEHLMAKRVRTLSGGQRQRLGIACATVHNPSLVILDEPAVGLDPGTRLQVRNSIVSMGKARTVVIASHMVEDVVRVCDSIMVVADGELLYQGDPDSLATAAASPSDGTSDLLGTCQGE